jgi:dihydropteroate synthase
MKNQRSFLDLDARGAVLTLGHVTRVMGILNCTPDSFSGDGILSHAKGQIKSDACLRYARKLVSEGADIIDIGGESTRPGALRVPLEEEIRRVVPVIKVLARQINVPISVDTSKFDVARQALDSGASIVNNIRAGRATIGFLKMVRDYQASIVIMHMRGTPASMQSKARYRDVVKEVI